MTTEERFLKDVATHEMIVLRDDGVYRHIRFKQPGTRGLNNSPDYCVTTARAA